MDSVASLTAYFHRQLDECLVLHQEALLVQDLDLAREFWQCFREGLSEHIDVEDRLIFPAFAHHVVTPRWALLVYTKEHEKLAQMVTKNDALLVLLEQRRFEGARAFRRQLLQVLDYQRAFRHVLEHHEEREEVALLPELEACLPAEELLALWRQAHASWLTPHELRLERMTKLAKTLP